MSYTEKIRAYYSLTKPGVLYGNVLTAAAGFFLASGRHIDWWLFLALLAGTTLVIGSACAINNYFDQDIDSLMERTKKRAIVSGQVPAQNALVFGIILGILGMMILVAYTNWLVVAIGAIGFVDYVVFYGMLSKRMSVHGTLVGSISGAMPILAGYVGAAGQIDLGAILVFAALFFWQMPEFYSIAIFRQKEYKAAHVPVISVVKGIDHTKREIAYYTVAFVLSTLLLSVHGSTGYIYFTIMAALGIYWIWLAIKGLQTDDSVAWSRKMFHFSLIILLAYSFLISIAPWLPF
ncbi:MAG TPA: heme o synthase [Candidatus Saccharimonadales bacterium]|nr:heme o synthase [Candidatus Saccharimonadales bacterium]